MASTILVVYDGAMLNHKGESGVLGIRTGNFTSEKYRDETGKEGRRAAAGLWLVLRSRPDTNTYQLVHAGQRIDYHGYRINVLGIGSDSRSMYVKVEIETPSNPAGS